MSSVPGICVGGVPRLEAPPHVASPDRAAVGTLIVAAGVGGVPGELHPVPVPEPSLSTQGLLLLKFPEVALPVRVVLVDSVAS